MKGIRKIISVTLVSVPFMAMAADFSSVISKINDILKLIVPLLIAVALIVFLVGVIKYVTSGGDEEKRKEARNVMIYGIIGLFVMVAVWGLVNVLVSTFGLQVAPPAPPIYPTQ